MRCGELRPSRLDFTEDEDEELEAEVNVRSFLFSFVMCFISRATMLPPLPPRDEVFLSSSDWASFRLSHESKTLQYLHRKVRKMSTKTQHCANVYCTEEYHRALGEDCCFFNG